MLNNRKPGPDNNTLWHTSHFFEYSHAHTLLQPLRRTRTCYINWIQHIWISIQDTAGVQSPKYILRLSGRTADLLLGRCAVHVSRYICLHFYNKYLVLNGLLRLLSVLPSSTNSGKSLHFNTVKKKRLLICLFFINGQDLSWRLYKCGHGSMK